MNLHEMEEQLKNIDVRTNAIEQILPTLATKDDLRLTTEALQHEMAKLATQEDVKDARRYALVLNEATRGDIRLVADHVLTMGARLDRMRAQLDRIEQRLR